MNKHISSERASHSRSRSSSKRLNLIRFHIKTQKQTPKEPLPRSKLSSPDTHQLAGIPRIKHISLFKDPEGKGDTTNALKDDRKNSLHFVSFQQKKLPELADLKNSVQNNIRIKQNSLSVREEPSSSSTFQRKKDERKVYPHYSIKIPFKQLIPIKVITNQQKLENLKLIRHEFQSLINTSNQVAIKSVEPNFRAYVEKGNNGILVKELLKKRWWWHLEEKDASKANFVWTQWFSSAVVDTLQQIQPSSLKTCEADYAQIPSFEEPKVQSIRMLVGESAFAQLKPRISLKNMNYFKNSQPKQQLGVSLNLDLKEIQVDCTNVIHNHVDGCLQLHSKKLLFKNFSSFLLKKGWDPFHFIPLTFYIDQAGSPSLDELLLKFDQLREQQSGKNVWIVKPGQNSNRGFGITVHDNREDLKKQVLKRLDRNGQFSKHSVIVQKYLENCFLINKRKFDIRCYILITTVNGMLKGYWYNDGYIRTSSEEYSLDDMGNMLVHLTNDAIQKKNVNYGKYQDYNKLSFIGFRRYLAKHGHPENTFDEAYKQMKLIAYYLMASVSNKIRRKQYTFELFGLDFMLDSLLKPLLIEANSNPCLETSGVILGKLIPELVDNVLMTAVDPLFPPPSKSATKPKEFIAKDYFQSNKFELIFTDTPNS